MKTHRLYDLRDREFVRLCRSIMISSPAASLRELALKASSCKAPRYYVDVEFAYRSIQRIRVTGHFPKRPHSRMMWEEIMGKVFRLRLSSPRLSLIKAVTEVIAGESASGFFIEPSSAVKILQRHNRRNKTEQFNFTF